MSSKEGTPPATSEDGAPQEVTPQQARTLKMLGLWEATRAGLLARLEDENAGELTASFFGATVRFLEASGISAQTAIEARDSLEDLRMSEIVKSIEDLDDDDDPQPSTKQPEAGAKGTPLDAPFTPRPPR